MTQGLRSPKDGYSPGRWSVLKFALLLCVFSGCSATPASEQDRDPATEAVLGDRATFVNHPYSAASFRNVDKIFWTRSVSRGGPVYPLKTSEEPLDIAYDFRGAHYDVDDFVARNQTLALLVLHGDTILHERYEKGATQTSRFMAFSVSKSIVSTLVGLSFENGLIRSVGDPITRYVSGLAESGYESVSIKHILQMSSGIDYIEEPGKPGSDFERLLMAARGSETRFKPILVEAERVYETGSRFEYSSQDTQALGWLIEAVAGQSLSEFMSERLWQPLGAEQDGFWIVDDSGADATEEAFGGFNATLRDFGRFGLLMAYDGVWRETRLLPDSWVAQATVPDSPHLGYGKLFPGQVTPVGYQYQWWALPDEDNSFLAQGSYGQFMFVNPVLDVVVVVLSNWPMDFDTDKWLETHALFRAIESDLRGVV